MLVSHWYAESTATTRLTTDMFKQYVAYPDRGRAVALQKARLKLMNDPEAPYYAHPMFWAVFVVVGEGGA